MSRKTFIPAIPEGGEDAIEAIKEAIEVGLGRRGDELDRFVTLRDLDESGFGVSVGAGGSASISTSGSAGLSGGGGGTTNLNIGSNDLTKPPRPRNVRAIGLSASTIGVTWSEPGYNNHRYAEIFSSKSDNWSYIRSTFDLSRPVGQGNSTPYFMGTSIGTTFLHRNLETTIPSVTNAFEVNSVSRLSDSIIEVSLSGALDDLAIGDDVVLSYEGGWLGNGTRGTVTAITGATVTINASLDADAGNAPTGTVLTRGATDDELDAALNPDPIYYWVRFVSQANVVGDVQSEAGIKGQVFLDTQLVLDTLIGRIRATQLSNDLLAPINYVRGPLVPRLDSQAQNINSLFTDLATETGRINQLNITTSDQESRLQSAEGFVSLFNDDIGGISSLAGFIQTIDARAGETGSDLSALEAWQVAFDPGNNGEALATRITSIEATANENGASITETNETVASLGSDLGVLSGTVSSINATVSSQGSSLTALQTWQSAFDPNNDGAALASVIQDISTEASAGQAVANQINGLSASINGTNRSGFAVIANAVNQRFVQATDAQAIAYVRSQLQAEYQNNVFLNEIKQDLQANADEINNAVTVRVQQDSGGLLTTAGFGIGLAGITGEDLTSSFIVSADQFAVMAAGSGIKVSRIQRVDSTRHRVLVVASATNVFDVDDRVVLTIPQGSAQWQSALRSITFKVFDRGWTGSSHYVDLVDADDDNDNFVALNFGTNVDVANNGVGIFKEQSVPFSIDTATSTVGIRGSLVVDGLIRADEGSITTLTSTEAFSTSITNFGLLNTQSIIGQAIATPRVGGWAVRLGAPDFNAPTTRVIQFSRWLSSTDGLPTPVNGQYTIDPTSYPQLDDNPNETAFLIGTRNTGGAIEGFGYLKGSLTIDRGARIYTRPDTGGHFVQMDEEFPMMIYPVNAIDQSMGNDISYGLGASAPDWDRWGYTSNVINKVRSNALFWVKKDGSAGFNSPSKTIYINDTPLEPPRGGGAINVVTRLTEDGGVSGKGIVHVQASFYVAVNKFWPYSQVGYSVFLLLGNAATNYGSGGSDTIVDVPSTRTSLVDPSGNPIMESGGSFMNTHFLVIRSSTNRDGLDAYNSWKASHSSSLYEFSSAFYHNLPDQRFIQGFAEVPAGNYKALVVVVERFALNGSRIYGSVNYATPSQNNQDVAVALGRGTIISQQTSYRQFQGTLISNTGSTGSDIPSGGSNPGGAGSSAGEPVFNDGTNSWEVQQ